MPTGNGGDALVHCRMLPGAWRRGNNLGRGNGSEEAPEGDIVDYCGVFERKFG